MTPFMDTTRLGCFLVAALFLLGGAACDGNGGDAADEPRERQTPKSTPELGGDQLERDRAEIELVDNEYRPSEVSFAGGEIVTVMLDNTGENGHTFTSPDLDVDVELQFGQQSRVDIDLPKQGEFEFYCRFHRDQGMTGLITAE